MENGFSKERQTDQLAKDCCCIQRERSLKFEAEVEYDKGTRRIVQNKCETHFWHNQSRETKRGGPINTNKTGWKDG